MKEEEYIKKCVEKFREKLGWGDSVHWVNQDFINLSELIKEKTGISISKNTLKYVFGKEKREKPYNPQQATKDALVKFLGYENWLGFIKAEAKPFRFSKTRIFRKPKRKPAGYIFLILLLAAAVFLITMQFTREEQKLPIFAELDILNSNGKNPHTIKCRYKITGRKIKQDSVWIDLDYEHQSQGYQLKLLQSDTGFISHCYQVPGYYNVRLVNKDSVLAHEKVHVKSDGWEAYFTNNTNYQKPNKGAYLEKFSPYLVFDIYKHVSQPLKEGDLHVPTEHVYQLQQDTSYYWSNFMNIRNFNCEGDSCSMVVKFENNPSVGGITCFDTFFELLCEGGNIRIKLIEKGCSRFASVQIEDHLITGETNDFSAFEFDASVPHEGRIETRGGKAYFYLDGQLIFQYDYSIPLKQLKGIIFTMKGSGKIHDLMLFDDDGRLVYSF